MKHSANLLVEAAGDIVGNVLADLGTYPHWNDLVQAAEPTQDNDDGPAWTTTLRAQVGPLARSKQLRFVRAIDETEADGSRRILFERSELDGREHAAWVMEVAVRSAARQTTEVTLALSYTGGLWMPALGNVLGSAIDRATTRLPGYVASLG